MAMVSNSSTARSHDEGRFYAAPLLHMHDECHECVVRLASRAAVPLISTTTKPTPSRAHS